MGQVWQRSVKLLADLKELVERLHQNARQQLAPAEQPSPLGGSGRG